jgi:hypothetical protein
MSDLGFALQRYTTASSTVRSEALQGSTSHVLLSGRRADLPIRPGREPVSPQLAQLVLEIVKLGLTAVVLVVIALILS